MPSFLSNSQAQTIGFLGAFVFGIAIRMAGAIGEHKEHADALLAEQMVQVSMARDDAQRSRDEAQRSRDDARRSEAHHRAVVENAAEGILTVGRDGKIKSFNGAAEAMFGWTAAEIVGRPVTTLIPPSLHDALVDFSSTMRYVRAHGRATQGRRDRRSATRRNRSSR